MVTISRFATSGVSCAALFTCGMYMNQKYDWYATAATLTLTRRPPPLAPNIASSEPLNNAGTSGKSPISSSTQYLTQEVVDGVLRDPRTIDAVVTLIKDVFTHQTTLDALKTHFKWEFTDNDETVNALKKFIVDDVILDAWVSEQLINLSKDLGTFLVDHPHIYPGATMDLLGAAALDALRTDRFQHEARESVMAGVRIATSFR